MGKENSNSSSQSEDSLKKDGFGNPLFGGGLKPMVPKSKVSGI